MKIYQMIFATRGLTCKRTVFLRQLGPMSFWFLSWYKSLTSLRLSSILPFRSLCSCPQHLHFLSNPVARECQENAPGGRMTRGKCPFPCRGPMSVLRCTGVVNRNRQLGSSRVIKWHHSTEHTDILFDFQSNYLPVSFRFGDIA